MDSIESAKIAAIGRSIREQMNLSKPDKDSEDYIKNVGEFHYEPSVGEIFTKWYARNRDIYESRMPGKSDRDLYLDYLLPLSPKDLTFEEMIEKCEKVFGDSTSLFNNLWFSFAVCAEILLKLLPLLDKNSDIILHHLVDEYNSFRSLIDDTNMVESNETHPCRIKKPEIDRLPENNLAPQP
ncbi:unnamed protein product [Hymenolepis diminuta]|uniref:Uncharacterized protein n=1 Tax=Hymenolepis diminuta TaxID=6216 RepID=A0A564YZW7_HYMDI|nr:unnamed protein product [Hymenolepis diminuta]